MEETPAASGLVVGDTISPALPVAVSDEVGSEVVAIVVLAVGVVMSRLLDVVEDRTTSVSIGYAVSGLEWNIS